MATLLGVVEVVVAWRDVGEQVPPLASDDLALLGSGRKVGEGFSGCHVWERSAAGGATFPISVVCRFGKVGQLLAFASADDE